MTLVGPKQQNLYHKQDGMCAYCGKQMSLIANRCDSVTRDHVIPRHDKRYKKFTNLEFENNIVGSCAKCNHTKGHKLIRPKFATIDRTFVCITQNPKNVVPSYRLYSLGYQPVSQPYTESAVYFI